MTQGSGPLASRGLVKVVSGDAVAPPDGLEEDFLPQANNRNTAISIRISSPDFVSDWDLRRDQIEGSGRIRRGPSYKKRSRHPGMRDPWRDPPSGRGLPSGGLRPSAR